MPNAIGSRVTYTIGLCLLDRYVHSLGQGLNILWHGSSYMEI